MDDKKVEEGVDTYTATTNRLLGEILNVIDILVPGDNSQMISSTNFGGKTQKQAAMEVIKASVARNIGDLRKQSS